jgi:Ni/Fe-hydrogenase subunit HybB-like protein
MTSTTMEHRKPFTWKPTILIWYLFLGVLLMIGLVSAVIVFWNGLVVTNMSDKVPWGLWITIDLSAIALGAGAFTLSAIVYLFRVPLPCSP